MIFFVHDDVGYKIIKFILSNYPEDIKIIFYKKINKNFQKELKNKLPNAKYLLWKNKNEKKFINLIKSLNCKLIFLLWWPNIISLKLIQSTTNGCINIHPGYLPFFKGKDPNFWSILFNGPFGVSIHYVNKFIDSGPIIFREKINNFEYDKNAKDLYNISKIQIINLFKRKYKFLRNTKKKLKTIKNISTNINYRKDMVKKSRIDLKKKYTAEYLINLMRAKTFPPHNGVIFRKNKKKFQVRVHIKKIDDKI